MSNDYPNPWNFSNADQNLKSPNGKYFILYDDLYEIAMGAPIGGACYLVFENKKIKLSDFCGGPILWNNEGTKIALPIWTVNRCQQIAVIDIQSRTKTLFKPMFRVLHFESFIGNIIFGIDSPIHNTAKLVFNTESEPIESVTKIHINQG